MKTGVSSKTWSFHALLAGLVFAFTTLCNCSDSFESKTKNNKTETRFESTIDTAERPTKTGGAAVSDTVLFQIKRNTPLYQQDCRLHLDTTVRLTNTAFYVIYTVNDGNCLTRFLMSFVYEKTKDLEILEQSCDGDIGSPVYKYSELRASTNHRFKKVLFVSSPKDKRKIDAEGKFNHGYTQDNVEMQLDSTIVEVVVDNLGAIARDTISHNKQRK